MEKVCRYFVSSLLSFEVIFNDKLPDKICGKVFVIFQEGLQLFFSLTFIFFIYCFLKVIYEIFIRIIMKIFFP